MRHCAERKRRMPEVRVQEAITSIQKIEHPKSPRILRVFRLYAASYFGETHAILFYEHRAICTRFFILPCQKSQTVRQTIAHIPAGPGVRPEYLPPDRSHSESAPAPVWTGRNPSAESSPRSCAAGRSLPSLSATASPPTAFSAAARVMPRVSA